MMSKYKDLEIEKLKLVIWMFSNRFPSDEDYKTMVVAIKLIYSMIFHLISPFMGLGVRER